MADKKKVKKPKKRVKKKSIIDRPVLPLTYTPYRKGCCVKEEDTNINLTSKLLELLTKQEPKKSLRNVFSQTENVEVKPIETQTETLTSGKLKRTSKKLVNDLIIYGKEPIYRSFSREEAQKFIEEIDIPAEEFRKKYINMPVKQKEQREIIKQKTEQYDKLFPEKPENVAIRIDNLGNIVS